MERNKNVLIFILIVSIGMLWFKYDSLKNEKMHLEYRIDDYASALDEANDNIEEANSNIEDAQNYAGEDYDDMEYALENLQTVDTVRHP